MADAPIISGIVKDTFRIWNAEYGGIEVSTGFALLLPVDFLLKKLIEDIVDNMMDAYVDNGPTLLANMLEDQIKSKEFQDIRRKSMKI